MRVAQAMGVALVGVGVVVVTDLVMRSSLLHLLRPQILSPADGAITTGPVNVRWEGPQPMEATLTGSGLRIDLGLRESPFEIDESRFPRPGQYGIELRSPRLGALVGVERRFMVRRAREREGGGAGGTDGGSTAQPPRNEVGRDDATTISLLQERDRLRAEIIDMQTRITSLQQDGADLDDALDELQADTDARLAAAEAQRAELTREHLLALQENQFLRQRMESIPPCTVWGYVALPRPQTNPPSRLVLVSDRAGDVFRSEAQCARVRRADRTGASPCVCVGTVWGP